MTLSTSFSWLLGDPYLLCKRSRAASLASDDSARYEVRCPPFFCMSRCYSKLRLAFQDLKMRLENKSGDRGLDDKHQLFIDKTKLFRPSTREQRHINTLISTKGSSCFLQTEKQTFISLLKCKGLSKRHSRAHKNLPGLFSNEATVQGRSFSGSQTAILLLNLHILLRQAWLQIQKNRKGNKHIQKRSSFTELLYLNNPRLSVSNIYAHLMASMVHILNEWWD